jgi:hypothetical protein
MDLRLNDEHGLALTVARSAGSKGVDGNRLDQQPQEPTDPT